MSGVNLIRGSDERDTRYRGTEASDRDGAELSGAGDDGEVVHRRRLDGAIWGATWGAIWGAIRFASPGRPDSIGF